METINLTVSGMTCSSCVKHVEKAIQSIAGVQKVEVDLASGAVKVESDNLQNVKAIITALEEEGYPAQTSSGMASQEKSGSCKSGSSCCCH